MKRSFPLRHILTITVSSLIATAAISGTPETKATDVHATPAAQVPARTHSGIEIEHLRLSAHGRLVDLRYRVTDPTKAADFAKRDLKPMLIDSQTGAKLQVPNSPKVGPLRQLAKGNDPKKKSTSASSPTPEWS